MLQTNPNHSKYTATSQSAHKNTRSVGYNKTTYSVSPAKDTLGSRTLAGSMSGTQKEVTMYKTCDHHPEPFDYDKTRTYQNAAESLVSNKTLQEQTTRRIKEMLMENKDNTHKLRQDMKKMETDFNHSMEMMANGMELRFREFTAKLKVECSFADKEHAALNKECEVLRGGWSGFGEEVNKSDRRQSELEEFCGTSHNLVATAYGTIRLDNLANELERASLQPVEE